ncbi:MAG TPA: hypothetical protein VLO31_09130 [Cryobacterium sp.]|nr:hypothetical protein [Cryobacterium sp.]
MTTSGTSAGAPAEQVTREGRRALVTAWISVALLPVSFLAAMVLGDALLSLQGYQSGGDEPIPLEVIALAGVPAFLVLIAPAIPAMAFGFRARRLGVLSGTWPAVIGAAALVFGLVTNALPLLLTSRGG